MINSTDPPISSASPDQRNALATAVQDFDWTRRLSPDVRSLVTTWLEIGDRAMCTISIVPPATGGGR
ncbi:hypothetical protein OHA25_08700 [Nonomuraea sp. NBC_00507]|uniref:hypothetical protein n=1 Tax=Nonomuraea sp. NBC_00507 TaxID=2976002 RepID=UPI002E179FF3